MVIRNCIAGIVFISLMCLTEAHAQGLLIGLDAGLSTFSMGDLKDFQTEQRNALPVDARIVENFPSYLNYGVNVTMLRKKIFLRNAIGHTSTGGRIYYSDYSGSMAIDMLPRMTYLSFQIGGRVLQNNLCNVFLGGSFFIYKNTLKVEQTLVLSGTGYSGTTATKYTSTNLAIGPLLEGQKKMGRLMAKIQLGYELHLAGRLYYSADSNAYLRHSSGDAVVLNADGLRASAGVSYFLAVF